MTRILLLKVIVLRGCSGALRSGCAYQERRGVTDGLTVLRQVALTNKAVVSNIEKVLRDVRFEKSGESRKVKGLGKQLVSTIYASPKGTALGFQKNKLSLLACNTRRKCYIETSYNSLKLQVRY